MNITAISSTIFQPYGGDNTTGAVTPTIITLNPYATTTASGPGRIELDPYSTRTAPDKT